MKAQAVRLVDIFLLGPFLVWMALTDRTHGDAARIALLLAGVLTISYNGEHYLLQRAQTESPR